MNLVYISPHFPRHYGLFVERAAALGVQVLGITDQQDWQLSSQLQSALTGHYRVDSIADPEQVLNACRFFRDRFGPLDRVESHLEPWIELEARVRDEFDIPGKKTADLGFIKRKSEMKSLFARAGVPTARGMLVTDLEACRRFIGKRYPVFIKPDIGVGAADTYTVRNDDDLRRFFDVKHSHPYFLEEYLSGVIESFDGLADRDGRVAFYTSHVFSNDIHKIVSNDENLAYWSVRDVPPDLDRFGHAVVEALEIREKFFHIEFFRLDDGSLCGLEVNFRPPGGLTTHMFNFACDIDVYDWWAHIVAARPYSCAYQRKFHCAYVGRKLNREYAYPHDAMVAALGPGLVHWQEMNPIEYAVMGQHGHLVRAADLTELHRLIRIVTDERVALDEE